MSDDARRARRAKLTAWAFNGVMLALFVLYFWGHGLLPGGKDGAAAFGVLIAMIVLVPVFAVMNERNRPPDVRHVVSTGEVPPGADTERLVPELDALARTPRFGPVAVVLCALLVMGLTAVAILGGDAMFLTFSVVLGVYFAVVTWMTNRRHRHVARALATLGRG